MSLTLNVSNFFIINPFNGLFANFWTKEIIGTLEPHLYHAFKFLNLREVYELEELEELRLEKRELGWGIGTGIESIEEKDSDEEAVTTRRNGEEN